MSKRAEDAAMKAYPVAPFGPQNITADDCNRQVFIRGYEQGEKDTIERAIQWLIANADDYIVDIEVSRYKPSKLIVGGMCWENLKKAMEEE